MPAVEVVAIRRDSWLDLLRAVAVIGVIGTHLKLPVNTVPPLIELPLRLWKQGGWVGVDLFFVLSGFLVSGLLFKELISNGCVSIRRFLIRRAFKIYPSFWIVLVGIIAARLILHSPIHTESIIGEILFLQNYVGKLSGPHWTLAIEEHFYLLLAFWFWSQTSAKILTKVEIRNRFRFFPFIFLFIALVCLSFRIASVNSDNYSQAIFMTHMRIDALMFGAILAWLWHLNGVKSFEFTRIVRLVFFILGILLLLPPFILDEENRGLLFQVLCFNGFYIGGGLLLLSGYGVNLNYSGLKALASIGTYSYGIYLCHDPLQRYLLQWIFDPESSSFMWCLYFITYVFGSIICGIILTRVVERPSLLLRDKLFPSNAGLCQ